MSDLNKADEAATYFYGYDLSRLETAYARVSDGLAPMRVFTDLVNEIDWTDESPEVFVKAIDFAFSLELSTLTRRLSELGHQLYPDHEQLEKLARLFALPRIIATNLPPTPGLSASMEWYQKHSQDHQGWWVAVLAGDLIGKARSRKELVEILGEANSNPSLLIAYIPK